MAATVAAAQKGGIHVFAHRGCWSRNAAKEFVIPENSVAAVAEARRQSSLTNGKRPQSAMA